MESKDIILTVFGDRLYKKSDSDCYQVFCKYGAVPQGSERICSKELLTIDVADNSNIGFSTSWGDGDVYVSTQREPVLKLGDLPKLAMDLGKDFKGFLEDRYFHISAIVFSVQYNTIAFIGSGEEELSFLGVFDLWEKKLLLFDYSDSLEYANLTWSPDGSRLALLKKSSSGNNIDFYELKGEGKIELVKTYELIAGIPVSIFRWSDDSETFYFSYLGSDDQWSEEQIDLSR